MSTEVTLPPELTMAAASLEQRLQILRVTTRRIQLAEWNAVPEARRHLIPGWLPTLLARFSLFGGVLECRHNYDDATWPRYFAFWGPAQFARELTSKDEILETDILEAGLVPISYEADGDMWVTSISDGPSQPIYLFSLTGLENIFASRRIALLMASMGVSERSYRSFGQNEGERSVMWCPD